MESLLRVLLGGMRNRNDGARVGQPARGGCSGRILIALLIVGFALFQWLSIPKETNPWTGREQRMPLTTQDDVTLGLQALPSMLKQHGGELADAKLQAQIDAIGQRILKANQIDTKTDFKFDFHLLKDGETINAFALPGGQVFMTYGLYKMLKTEDEVAGVLGHEIGHVVGRHSAEQAANNVLTSGIANATGVLVSDGGQGGQQLAQLVGQVLSTRYSREDENESDELGVQFMHKAGYDPRGLLRVMEVLEQASGGASPPEFISTHPNPGNRAEKIKAHIERLNRPAEAPSRGY